MFLPVVYKVQVKEWSRLIVSVNLLYGVQTCLVIFLVAWGSFVSFDVFLERSDLFTSHVEK